MDAGNGNSMNVSFTDSVSTFVDYSERLQAVMKNADWTVVGDLAELLSDCWREGNRLFLCGNGGSAGNAIHLANDFLYGISRISISLKSWMGKLWRFFIWNFQNFRLWPKGYRVTCEFCSDHLSR